MRRVGNRLRWLCLLGTFGVWSGVAAAAQVASVAPPPDGTYPSAAPGFTPYEPPGVAGAFAGLTSQPGAHTAFTFDRDMLQSILGGNRIAGLNAITVQNFRYREPAFYVPEAMAALGASYGAAGWKHLVEANVSAREQTMPAKPISDVWLHFRGAEIDEVAVLIRASKQMNVIEVSGLLRPLDLMRLGGKFGIPAVDPGAVMVPAAPGH